MSAAGLTRPAPTGATRAREYSFVPVNPGAAIRGNACDPVEPKSDLGTHKLETRVGLVYPRLVVVVVVCIERKRRLFEGAKFFRHCPIGQADVVNIQLRQTHDRRRIALGGKNAYNCART